jgi:hypothetical protein
MTIKHIISPMKWYKNSEIKSVPVDDKYVAPYAFAWLGYAEIEIINAIIDMTDDIPTEGTEKAAWLGRVNGLKQALHIVQERQRELDEKTNGSIK